MTSSSLVEQSVTSASQASIGTRRGRVRGRNAAVVQGKIAMSQQASANPESELDDKALFFNRELSWLAFNSRVLEQARDPSWPLLERVKFLAIHGSNLDEFFMIRVSGLQEQLDAGITEPLPDGYSTGEQLTKIRAVALEQLRTASRLYRDELWPALTQAGVRIHTWQSLNEDQRAAATDYFRRAVFPVLTPLALDPGHPFPFLSNLSLSLAVHASDPTSAEPRLAFVKIPETLPRFVQIPGSQPASDSATGDAPIDLLTLEELTQNHLGDLFPGVAIEGSYPFRVTRDMDIEILQDEASDLLSAVDREVRRRKFGAAVRLEVAPGVPERVRAMLVDKLEIEDDAYEVDGPLGLSGLMQIAALARPQLRDAAFSARVPAVWLEAADPFAAIRQGDILLHHPYDAFTPVLELLSLAADDPNVLAIKMILYRTSAQAEVIKILIRAAEKGKQVAVSIELKARFDEENNIGWARALERSGVHVFYGTAGFKTHAKALLIVRREGAELRRYVHLSTGNYNATTAKIYTDIALLTCDPNLGEDTSDLFNALSGFSNKSQYQRVIVAPVRLRTHLIECIERQRQRALEGKEGRIFAKMNSLVDKQVIQALYRASQAGVNIELLVRGICCLRPGLPGVSENIRVRSLLGRFLEHSRVICFGPEGEEELYLSSADWMPRNFDRRVELMFPILNEAVRKQIITECLLPVQADNSRVYEMDSSGIYHRRQPKSEEKAVDAQMFTLEGVRSNRPRFVNLVRSGTPLTEVTSR
jgi:polyphosphate kinase